MFFAFFSCFSASWSEKIMATVAHIALEKMGNQYQANLSKIFLDTGDFDLAVRPAQTGAWMYYVERAPFNIKSFNHWHFVKTPYNPENLSIPNYVDDDSLVANMKDLNSSLIKGEASTTWPYSLCLKIAFSSIIDLQAPLHTIEYFSSDFPDGDRSGRLFNVIANGKETNLFDFYESGCGLTPQLEATYDSSFWSEVKEFADQLLEDFSWRTETVNQNSYQKWADTQYDWTIQNIYSLVKPGSTITQDMISDCQYNTRLQMIRAAERLYAYLQQTKMVEVKSDQVPVSPMSTSEVMAWSLAAVLSPLAALLVWKKHFSKL